MRPLPLILFENENGRSEMGQCDCDCDCACTPSESRLTPISTSEPLPISTLRVSLYMALPLDENHFICVGARCKPTVLNQSARAILDDFQDQRNVASYEELVQTYGQNLADEAIRQLVDAGLLIPDENTLPTSETKTLTAWLHVTDHCNLRCTYCYLPHAPENMPIDVGNECIRRVFGAADREKYSKVKIKYAGGEPLLRFENIRLWHSLASHLASTNQVALEEIILSNGTLLTLQRAQEIKDCGMGLMISLDGLDSTHNQQRSYKNGHSSLEGAISAIEMAQQVGISPQISITITPQNMDGLPELVRWLRSHDLHFNLNFARQNMYYTSMDDQPALIDNMLKTFEVIKENMPNESILAGLIDRTNLAVQHTNTCAVEKDYLVFDMHGRVSRCQMEMFHPEVPFANEDPLSSIRNSLIPLNISVDEKQGCSTCEWKYWCAGGCPLLTKLVVGRVDVRSPYCSVYKALIPEAFRLEGYRLLMKYKNEQMQ